MSMQTGNEWTDEASLLIRVWLAGDPEVTDFYRVRADASTSLEWIDTESGLGELGPIGPTGGAVIGAIDEVMLVTDNSPPVHLEGLESRSGCIGQYCNGDLCRGLYWSPNGKWLATCAPVSPQSGAETDPNVHIGRIPLPAELTSSSGGPSTYDPEMAPYSEPSSLTWGPDGTLVAYLLSHYPEPIFDDEHWATCSSEIVFADVATAQVLGRSPVPCVDWSWSPLVFLDAETVLYADYQHSMLARIDEEPVQLDELEGKRWHRLWLTQDGSGVYLLTGIRAADDSQEASLRFSRTDALRDGGEWSTLWTGATRASLLFGNGPKGSAAMLIIASDRCTDDCDDVIHVFDGNAETTLIGSLHVDLQPRFPFEARFTPDGHGIVTSRRDGVFLSAGAAYADEYRLRDEPVELDHSPSVVSLILPSVWPND